MGRRETTASWSKKAERRCTEHYGQLCRSDMALGGNSPQVVNRSLFRVGPDPRLNWSRYRSWSHGTTTHACDLCHGADGKRELASFRHRIMMGYVHVLCDVCGGTMAAKSCSSAGCFGIKCCGQRARDSCDRVAGKMGRRGSWRRWRKTAKDGERDASLKESAASILAQHYFGLAAGPPCGRPFNCCAAGSRRSPPKRLSDSANQMRESLILLVQLWTNTE